MLYLRKIEDHQDHISQLQRADIALIVFPLYTDCMPGIVMAFLERLEPLRKSLSGLKLGFIVHSGFPEAVHSRAVEKYLQWLAKDLGAEYLGTVIMGSSNSLREMQFDITQGKGALFAALGRSLVVEHRLDPEVISKISGLEKFSTPMAFFFKVAISTGQFNTFWDQQLKRNNAYPERHATPYADRL